MFILALVFEGQFYHGEHLRWNLSWTTPNYAGAFLATLLPWCWIVGGRKLTTDSTDNTDVGPRLDTASEKSLLLGVRRLWAWFGTAWQPRCVIGWFCVEVIGCFLLAKTYSRGALVAWGLAWLFGVVASRAWRDPVQRLLWAARVGALAVMLLAAGFGWSRVVEKGVGTTLDGASASDGPTFGRTISAKQSGAAPATEDGSVVNRLALWHGGLQMITAAPLHGWGAGESGRAYMNWFQEVNRTEGYTTMVNSYLHVGVEHGLPILAGVLFALAGMLVVAAKTAVIDRRYSEMALAAGASLAAWAVANVFTSLWIEPKIWIVPGIACAAIVFGGWRSRRVIQWRWIFGVSVALTVLLAGGLLAAGLFLRAGQAWRAEPGEGRTVVVRSRELSRGELAPTIRGAAWQVWPDTGVLGPTPGKELRRWIETLPTATCVVVHPATPGVPADGDQTAGNVVLFGRQAERLGRVSMPKYQCRQLVLVHPRGVPPTKWVEGKEHPQVTVLIPAIDEMGEARRWQRWATEQGARVIVSPGVGQDIRAVWPEVFEMVAREGKDLK